MTTLPPFIGIVQGDACGIGPELMYKLLRNLQQLSETEFS